MSRITKLVQFGIVLWAAVVLVVPQASWAQAAKGKKAPGAAVEVEEITVTAQKREENIQETPVSITAITSEALKEQQVSNIVDLQAVVPNLHITGFTGSNSSLTISMRGVAQADNDVSLEPSVGLYVDGVYIAKIMGANLDLEDLERVEVLRGPQGTLFGRNTAGGAVNMITQKPTDQRSLTLQTDAGNYEYFRGRLTANVPLIGRNGFFQSDALGTLSLRENVTYGGRDGFYQNTGSGSSKYDNLNRLTTMTSLRWQPTKDITVDYSAEYHRYNNASTLFQAQYIYPGSPVDGGPFDLHPWLRPDRVDALPTSSLCKTWANGVRCNLPQSDDGNHRLQILTGTWDVGDMGPLGSVTLKSISSYRNLSLHQDQDLSGSPLSLAQFGLADHIETWSEELQWVGTAPRVHYVMGLYYYGERDDQLNNTYIFQGATDLFGETKHKVQSYAPFGQLTWTPPVLSDKLSLTAGIRYTQEQVHFNRQYNCVDITANVAPSGAPPAYMNVCNIGIPGLQNFNVSGGKSFGSGGAGFPGLSPMGNIAYQWTDNLMTYFNVSRGFKGGTFSTESSVPQLAVQPVNPERLLAYEGGFKSQWFDNRLRVNADGFFEDYKDQQISVFRAGALTGVQVAVENAGASEIWGAELETDAVLIRGVVASVNYSYLSPKFTTYSEQAYNAENQPIIGQTVNVASQRRFALAPEHTFTVGLTYTAPPTTSGTFSAHVDTNWQDAVVFAPVDFEHDAQGSYAVVNGRLQLASIPLTAGSLDLALWGRNLFDRRYRTFGIDFGQSLGWAGNKWGEPRTFGLQLTYNFAQSS